MTSLTARVLARTGQNAVLRSWRTAAGLLSVAAGATIVAGAFLPWVETFAGLAAIPGVRGGNGKILAVAGLLITVAGLWQLARGGQLTRWLAGLGGFCSLAFSGYLLVQLSRSLSALGSDSMVIARAGPGLWVVAAGSAAAFAGLFLPPSSQTSLRSPGTRGALLAWAADHDSAGLRRGLQVALGLAWLADAALQAQPAMFGPSFVSRILAPAAMGNPALVADPVLAATRVVASDAALLNAAFVAAQAALGAGLLWRRTARAALAGTVCWALAVWWLGEGLGGVLTAAASPLTGAPGAAVLYALLAVLVWPAPHDRAAQAPRAYRSVAATGPLGSLWPRLAWLLLWGSLAWLALRAQPAGPAAAAGSPAAALTVPLAVACALVAASIFATRAARPALLLAGLAAVVIWTAGEDFGGILTGLATDLGTGPILLLLAASFWPLRGQNAIPASAANAAVTQPTGTQPAGTQPAGQVYAPAPPTGDFSR